MKVTGNSGVGNNLVRYYPILQLDSTFIKTEDVVMIWNAISTLVEKHLDCRKGFVLPGIGTFTYITKEMQLEQGVSRVTLTPIFIISDKLAISFWLKRPPVYFEEVAPSETLNFYVLANFLSYDFPKLRLCYSKIISKMEHYVLIRKSFALPFPGVGKFILEGCKYKFKFNSEFLATHTTVQTKRGYVMTPPLHATCVCDLLLTGYPLETDSSIPTSKLPVKTTNRNKRDTVRRTMNDVKQIQKQYNTRVFNPSSLPKPTEYKTIPPLPQSEHLVQSQFRASYPKPCLLGNCSQPTADFCPERHNPGSMFMSDFVPKKRRFRYPTEMCLGLCEPATSHALFPETHYPRVGFLDRLNAGQDRRPVGQMADFCVPFTEKETLKQIGQRKLVNEEENKSRDYLEFDRKFRAERKLKQKLEDMTWNLHLQRLDAHHHERQWDKKLLLHRLYSEAIEFDKLRVEMQNLLERNAQSENDFSNQYFFWMRPKSPMEKEAKVEFNHMNKRQRECRRKKKELEDKARKIEEISLREYMTEKYQKIIEIEKQEKEAKIKKQKLLLDLQDRPAQWKDADGEYFTMPQDKNDKYRQMVKKRMIDESKQNLKTAIKRRLKLSDEKTIPIKKCERYCFFESDITTNEVTRYRSVGGI